jgi:hypothetical protein
MNAYSKFFMVAGVAGGIGFLGTFQNDLLASPCYVDTGTFGECSCAGQAEEGAQTCKCPAAGCNTNNCILGSACFIC